MRGGGDRKQILNSELKYCNVLDFTSAFILIIIIILHDFFNIPDNNADDNAGARIAGLYGCPICGLGLTPPELEEHFAQEVSLDFLL